MSYTTKYTPDYINQIIGKYDSLGVLVFTNMKYNKPANGSWLDREAFWREIDFYNKRLYNFILFTCYDENNEFKWNFIVDVYYDEQDKIELRNFTGDVRTKQMLPVSKSRDTEPQFVVDVRDYFNNTSLNPDSNYVYKFTNDSKGKMNYYNGKPANQLDTSVYTNMYKVFVDVLCGNDVLNFVETDKLYYEFLFSYKTVVDVTPSNLSYVSSTIQLYSNRCSIILPDDVDGYISGLKSALSEKYRYYTLSFVDLSSENRTLDWTCNELVLSYIIGNRIFTVCYRLTFNIPTEGVIDWISTERYNGKTLYTVAKVSMEPEHGFSASYINGEVSTDPGDDVTVSEISLDVKLAYNSESSTKYTLTYQNTWYNYAESSGTPSVALIALVKY